MKFILTALFVLYSLPASALSVVAKGYGTDYNSALSSAKISALEQATGTWVVGEQNYRNGNYSEEMHEYNSGVIKSYEVIKFDSFANEITIKAEVDSHKDNRANSYSSNIPESVKQKLNESQEKNLKISQSITYLNDPNKAISARIINVDYNNRGNFTDVKITAVIGWIPKFKSDLEELAKTVGIEGSATNNNQHRAIGYLETLLLKTVPYAAAAGSLAWNQNKPMEPELKKSPMMCFADNKKQAADECYTMSSTLTKFQSNINAKLIGKNNNGSEVFSHVTTLQSNNLYELIEPGDHKKNRFGYEVRYNQPTFILYRKEQMQVNFSFSFPTEHLKRVDNFIINFE